MSAAALVRRALLFARAAPADADEFLALAAIALPVILTYLTGFAQAMIGLILVGHVDATSLAAATLANMLCNALGMSIVIGCSSACDTLASQAFGARNLARIGHVSQRGAAVGLALCVPVAVLFVFSGLLLRALGQDEAVVGLASDYIRWLLIGMPALCAFEVLKKHLTNIGLPNVPLALTVLGTLVNLGAGVGLVFYTPLGFHGAPLANGIGAYTMLGAGVLYFRSHRRVNSALKAAGLGALVASAHAVAGADAPAGDASEASAAAAAEGATSPSAAGPQTPAPDAAAPSQSQTLSLVSSGAGVVVDVEKLVEEPGSGSGAPSAAVVALAVTDPFEEPAPTALPAVAAQASSADTFPPLPSDIDDIIDATWTGFSPSIALSGWGEYLSLGLPSAAMLFFEWASYEATAVIAGLMSVNSLATHSILATTASMAFMPILGFGVATMMRIGNRLGERKPAEAQRAFRVGMCVWVVYACLNATFLCSIAPVWGRVFTDDPEVDAHVQRILWILAVYGVFDTGQCILSFVFRAVGRPGLAAVANGTGYMVVGLPLAYSIGVVAKLNVIGLWVGYSIAVTLVFCLLSIVLSRLKWADEAERAYKRAMSPDSHAAATGH